MESSNLQVHKEIKEDIENGKFKGDDNGISKDSQSVEK